MADKLHSSTTITGSGLDKYTTTSYTINRDDGTSVTRVVRGKTARERVRVSLGLSGLVVCILLVASIFTNLIQGTTEPVTFQSLLLYLQNAPSVSVVFESFQAIPFISGDLGIFNFITGFLNLNITILNFLITFVRLLGAVVEYIFYLVRFLVPMG